ncbi:methylmalonic aciduria and homocystinuria type D protein [Myxosarcina sp. GI1]|uniref:methylmalonic aciduria and homocystinuria type D protein n=1 Tax=Myxosarcina sp. GI1 TaxID=1541065 RepID=UPI000563DEAE|nr:methylmalonic aciduria and homocystinuria type D protein [Myxosarcina sp. GI1]
MGGLTSQPYLNLIAPTDTAVEIYLDRPSQFIIDNQKQLLPTWDKPVTQVILVLQQSRLSLEHNTEAVAREKDRLREQFFRFGCSLVFGLRDRNLLSDLCDPRSGYPVISREGEITLSDAALVKALLGFEVIDYNDCSLIIHPQWGSAMYPSTILTSAGLDELKPVLDKAIALLGWTSK